MIRFKTIPNELIFIYVGEERTKAGQKGAQGEGAPSKKGLEGIVQGSV